MDESTFGWLIEYEQQLREAGYDEKTIAHLVLEAVKQLKQENMSSKRTYIATFWRSNPQLKNGGYFTTREFQSVSLQGATKQAERYAASNMYGGMAVKSVELKQENSNGK